MILTSNQDTDGFRLIHAHGDVNVPDGHFPGNGQNLVEEHKTAIRRAPARIIIF